MPPPWDLLVGPAGLAVGAILGLGVLGRVIQLLWRELQRASQRDRDETDRALGLLDKALDGNRDAAIAASRLPSSALSSNPRARSVSSRSRWLARCNSRHKSWMTRPRTPRPRIAPTASPAGPTSKSQGGGIHG